MASDEHLSLLRQGTAIWNEWRERHPDAEPNLRGADLRGADLRRANLNLADLTLADLAHADLRGANLSWATLSAANLKRSFPLRDFFKSLI